MNHEQYLQQALALAEVRRGFCAPNPAVGAVVVKNGEVLATGYHWACGAPHAESDALNKLGMEAEGATLYVTLEPCSHTGKTPPCTDLIQQRGIVKVVYAQQDLNPKVSGKGEQALRALGVDCERVEFPAINEFYKSYRYWHKTGRPWVTAKLAVSLDGHTAGPNGEAMAITGEELKAFTHQQRKRADAILTTAKTINNDNPQMNARLPEAHYRKPIYILDTHLTLNDAAQVFVTTEKITVFHGMNVATERVIQLQDRGVTTIAVSHMEEGLCLDNIIHLIGQEGMHDLWVEAGAKCFQALLKAQLVQRAYVYIAPKQLGYAQAAFMSNKILFENALSYQMHAIGNDACCEINWSAPCSPG